MTVYKYLGYGVTNESGVAKLDHDAQGQEISHSYTGVGAGEIDVVASLDNPVESGSIVSEPCNVLDCIKCDISNSLAVSDYSLRYDTDSLTIVDDYKDFSTSEPSGRRLYLPVTTTGDVRIEMEIKFTTTGNIGVIGSDGTTLQYGQFNNDSYRNNWTKVVMVQNDGVISMTASTDGGSTWETKTLNSNAPISIGRVLWTVANGHCYSRNVKVYPI